MSNIQFVAPRLLGAAAAPQDPKPTDATSTDATDTYTPTPEEAAIAAAHPPGAVQVERAGLKLGTRITGGALGLSGAAILGISLLSRGNAGGASRLLAGPLVAGGGLVALGAGAAIGAELIKPREEIAVATKFATRGDAQQYANKMVGRVAKIVQEEGGTWAVLDRGPVQGTYGYQSGGGYYYGDRYSHGYRYDNGNRYYEPYYPGRYGRDYYPDYNWGGGYNPWDTYPIPSGGYTSPGDDYYPGSGGGSTSPGDGYYPGGSGGGSYPSSGGGTSSGDDGGGYDPPSYNPPSYDPPSYDPPSYDPPSYGGGSDYGGGNSSSNGNPSYDDF